MTLKEKLEVLEELERGRSLAEVGRLHNVNESTIRGIRKIGDKIRTSIAMKLRVCLYVCTWHPAEPPSAMFFLRLRWA